MAQRRRRGPPVDMVVPPVPFNASVSVDYAGDVFVWDLDKTYLRTEFASLRELIRTALEKATDKVAYPGATQLLRALRRGPGGVKRPVYFVSASPPQLRDIIVEKFTLDGVEMDGIYFKDNLRNMRPGRFARIREHMGYKLLALLDLRKRLPAGAVETFFGDDVETDAAIYSVYGQIQRGFLSRGDLIDFLEHQGVFHDEAVRIAWRTRLSPQRALDQRIYLQVRRSVDPRYYRRFGLGVRATRNYFQCALLLADEGKIELDDVAAVGDDMLARGGASRSDLLEDLDDLGRRRMIADAKMVPFIKKLSELGVLPAGMS